jgi:hypothetical protein
MAAQLAGSQEGLSSVSKYTYVMKIINMMTMMMIIIIIIIWE